MSERAELLFDGITGIRDDIIESSERYVFQRKVKGYRGFVMLGTMAACVCLLISVVISGSFGGSSGDFSQGKQEAVVADNAECMPAEGIGDSELEGEVSAPGAVMKPAEEGIGGAYPFDILMPEWVLAGYELAETQLIFDGNVLQASYDNEELQDTLIIRIAQKDWFGEVELEKVQYGNGTDMSGSYMYIAGGEYIAEYSLSSRDIAETEGFYDMVYSAPYFQE